MRYIPFFHQAHGVWVDGPFNERADDWSERNKWLIDSGWRRAGWNWRLWIMDDLEFRGRREEFQRNIDRRVAL